MWSRSKAGGYDSRHQDWRSEGDMEGMKIVTKNGKQAVRPKMNTRYNQEDDYVYSGSYDNLRRENEQKDARIESLTQMLRDETVKIADQKNREIEAIRVAKNKLEATNGNLERELQAKRDAIVEKNKEASLQQVVIRSLSEAVGSFYEIPDVDSQRKVQKAGELFAERETKIHQLSELIKQQERTTNILNCNLDAEVRKVAAEREKVERLEKQLTQAKTSEALHKADYEQTIRIVEQQKQRYETAERKLSEVEQEYQRLRGAASAAKYQYETTIASLEQQLPRAREELQRQRILLEERSREVQSLTERLQIEEATKASYEEAYNVLVAQQPEQQNATRVLPPSKHLEFMKKFQQAIGEINLECPVCIEPWSLNVAPRVTSCGHTVCVNCIPICKNTCPVCRHEIGNPQVPGSEYMKTMGLCMMLSKFADSVEQDDDLPALEVDAK